MAERDGTIVIDTQIDTKGVDAGSEKTEASLCMYSFLIGKKRTYSHNLPP